MSRTAPPPLNGAFIAEIAEGRGRPRATPPPEGQRAVSRIVSLIDADPRGTTRMAADAGLDRRQLQRLRSGERGAMTLSSAAAILAALGRTWRDLDD